MTLKIWATTSISQSWKCLLHCTDQRPSGWSNSHPFPHIWHGWTFSTCYHTHWQTSIIICLLRPYLKPSSSWFPIHHNSYHDKQFPNSLDAFSFLLDGYTTKNLLEFALNLIPTLLGTEKRDMKYIRRLNRVLFTLSSFKQISLLTGGQSFSDSLLHPIPHSTGIMKYS